MKHVFISCIVILLSASVAIVSGIFWGSGSSGYSNSNSGARVCVIRNCTTTTNACGRYGRSNLCQRFSNSCQLKYQACISSAAYTSVALSRCSGISVGSRGVCGGSSSSSYSSLLSSSSSSSSNVVPIIIRRG